MGLSPAPIHQVSAGSERDLFMGRKCKVKAKVRKNQYFTLPHQSNQTLTRLQAVLMVWFWLLGLHSDSDQTLLGLYLDSRIDILNLCLKMKFACISMNWTLSLLHLACISRFFGALTTWAKCLIYFCIL